MNKILTVILFFCFTLSAWTQIRVKTSTIDLGDILEDNGVVIASFELLNPYFKDTITILDYSTSCGCTAILNEETFIYPRQTIQLKVSYDPNDRVGLFAKSIHLKTKTGRYEENSLYLKLTGNVIGKEKLQTEVPVALIDYKVAPIYFYPITVFDTSFFDLNKIIDFVNDITYEIDYYNFTTVGIEIRVRDKAQIEQLEILMAYYKHKLKRELNRRQYGEGALMFANTVFIADNRIPAWSVAQIKVYSNKFNADALTESVIEVTKVAPVKRDVRLLAYSSEEMPKGKDLVDKLDLSTVNAKLFKNGRIDLNVTVKVPASKGKRKARKIGKSLDKNLYRTLKKSSGITKADYQIVMDTIAVHAKETYEVEVYDVADNNKIPTLKYVEKPESVIVPLLPTYKAQMFTAQENILENSADFKQFWNALLAYTNTGNEVQITIESSGSNYPKKLAGDPYAIAQEKGEKTMAWIKEKYFQATGKKLLVELIVNIQGPSFETQNFTQPQYFNFEYIKLVPNYLKSRNMPLRPIKPKPYIVNYDYYYVGIDTGSIVFQKFADYLIYEVQKNGFVTLRTESSASHIPVDEKRSNEYWAYSHLQVSKERLYDYLKKRLIDPNRVLITNEKIVVQGIPYDKKTPIVRYRNFQYVTFVPQKYL
ncbi:DUF1573 domain-containing protein [Putridiphycobacter roseus]|uniref:DUF1573 domain-containing protein n=1 Tax=Putridiphycobacter roseus TaxID=2219161 RepID=UPI00131442DF|nr:DUF1573 domain-containing protein [Putridiphycobacter roseus]